MIYLDSAATSFLKPPSVRQAMLGAMQHMTSPGRGGHRLAMAAAETVYRCRQEAAAAAAPKAAVTCPHCGASTIPDEEGRCEYCGSALMN